jgi:hypothetical protein
MRRGIGDAAHTEIFQRLDGIGSQNKSGGEYALI